MTALFSCGNVSLCLGLAALWLCLQSSGYYPLSVADYDGDMETMAVAFHHLLYGIGLVAFSFAAIAARRSVERILCRPGMALAAGLVGVGGHLLLWWGGTLGLQGGLPLVLGAIFVALFIVSMVLLWGTALTSCDLGRALGLLIVSFLAAQIIVVAVSLVGLDQRAFVVACALVCSVCAIVFLASGSLAAGCSADEGLPAEKPSLLRSIPWGMVAPTVLLLYFCEIFIRLRSGSYLGAVDPQRQVITGSIALVAFAIVASVFFLSRQAATEKGLILVFSLLMVVYLLALVGMLIFDADNRYVTNRILVACSHCDEVFLWMILVPAVKRSGASPVVAFALLVVFALAIPWALSFDLYYLAGLDAFFATRDVLVYGVALALVVATTGTVGFLLIYVLRGQGAATGEAAKPGAPEVGDILAPYDLTPRETEVAEYLSRGHSARKIAEELFLSEASIRAHTQHIYRKMGIHSKQEFLDYIDEAQKA